jgi:hypothetical protein
MPDRLVTLLLKLYPEEFRQRFGPQIEADLYHPETNFVLAIFDIFRSAIYHRVTSPGPYVWVTAITLAAAIVTISGTITLQSASRLLQVRVATNAEIYAMLFITVFIVILSVLLLAINWLQKCSKSKG